MYLRLSFWAVLFGTFVALLEAQPAPATAAGANAPSPGMTPGQIVAKMVNGKVTMDLNGVVTELTNDAPVNQGATVTTAADASVVLVFSNGATTQLGPDTSLSIEQFLQSPFQQAVALASATQEPSTSRTKLKLNKGELLGKVAKLKHNQGSTFEVQTPVGAAGIRGTTFRIVFRPTGTGQAFAVFSLSTLEGNVNFQQGAPGTPGQPPTPGTPTPPTPAQPEGGVPVVTGQEVVVTVSVVVSTSGQVTITAPPVVTSTQPMSVETLATITRQAEVVATAASTTTFTPTPPTTGGDGGQNQSGGEGNNGSSPNANEGSGNAGQNNASENANNGNANNSNNNNSNTGTPSSQSNSQQTTNLPSPPPTTNAPRNTPGDGKPGS